MAKIEYTPLNLPKTLVEELKVWRLAFCAAYGKTVSYGQMIRGMLDSLEDSDPAVVDELGSILAKHPELEDKMMVYRSIAGQDSKSIIQN
ncbi:MAG: hypothetical protein IJL42_01785 [Bacteroidales bacterium]|nr:hypothetical protein [Bacteroidales bacterium]